MSRYKPTIEDVARVAGVSRATASRVINNAPGASGPLRVRVQAAAAELGHQPNETARALASGRQRTVDVIAITYSPGIGWLGTHPYFSRVLDGMMPLLEVVNAQLRLHALGHETAAEMVDEIAENTTIGAVLADITPALATRFYRRCRTGYLRAVRHLGLTEVDADGDFHREGGYHAAKKLLEQHPDIDAMFIACDLIAARAIQATGRRVADDVSIIGFDDSIASVCSNPALTTIRLPVEDMAAATRLLLEGNPAPGHRQRFPVDLVLRDSTRNQNPRRRQ